VLTFCQRWIHGFGIGTLVAAMLPYSLAFLVSGLLMTMAWVWLHVPVGPGAPVGFVQPQ
jgi:aminobenzoyl-glutamate transport protein